jgi:hypothetical protein
MTKKEESVQERLHCCLNPDCLYPHLRFFPAAHQHATNQQCARWILPLSALS